MLRVLAGVFAFAISLTACSPGSPTPSPKPSTPVTPSTPATAPASPSVAPTSASPPAATPSSASPKPSAACPAKIAGDFGSTNNLLTAVRVGTHAGYDRVTFEFGKASGLPVGGAHYEISKTTDLTKDGSGEPMQVAGTVHYLILFMDASGFDSSGNQGQTFKGPYELKPNFKVLAELEQRGDFEGYLSWIAGLKSSSCPQVSQFTNPFRIAVDFPH
jgi:hypothetical protein